MFKEFISEIKDIPLHDASDAQSGAVLLAVSGGMDSMCMADMFLRSGKAFAIAHCNFCLRGEESEADTELVRAWAESAGIPLHVKYFETEEFSQANGVSIEMAARELRYRWFASLCESFGYSAVAVAHNANDNAETLVLNIVRGAGLKGISGMSKVSDIPYNDTSCSILVYRPLLRFTRKQIEGYVRAHNIPYRDDSTNAEVLYKRNKIRHQVFPVFEQINPSFLKTINREMEYYDSALKIVDDFCKRQLSQIVTVSVNDTILDIRQLTGNRNWEYILYYFLSGFGFNSSVISSVGNLIKTANTFSGKEFRSRDYILCTAPGGLLKVRKYNGKHTVATVPYGMVNIAERLQTDQNDKVVVFRADGVYHFSGRSVESVIYDREKLISLKQPQGTLIFDADKLRYPFLLRVWSKGDWFVPFGMKGRKKLSDFFGDRKMDKFEKEDALVIVPAKNPEMHAGRVAAVLGMRIDDNFKITDSTTKVLMVRVKDQ